MHTAHKYDPHILKKFGDDKSNSAHILLPKK